MTRHSHTISLTHSMSSLKLIGRAFLDSLPISLAYIPLGATWGILWEQSGLDLFWIPLFSIFVYTGSIQFIALSFIENPTNYFSLIATTLPIAMRCSFYTATLYDKLPPQKLAKTLCCWGLVDGAFGLLAAQNIHLLKRAAYSTSLTLFIHCYWVSGTLIGGYLGTYIPNSFQALNFALPCLVSFLVFQQILSMGFLWPSCCAILVGLSLVALGMHAWLLPALMISTALVFFLKKYVKGFITVNPQNKDAR